MAKRGCSVKSQERATFRLNSCSIKSQERATFRPSVVLIPLVQYVDEHDRQGGPVVAGEEDDPEPGHGDGHARDELEDVGTVGEEQAGDGSAVGLKGTEECRYKISQYGKEYRSERHFPEDRFLCSEGTCKNV